MEALHTEPKQCSMQSCKNSIPPPDPVSKEYSTCISCQACDAVSKERNKQKWSEGQSDVPWLWPQLETAAGQSGDGNTGLQALGPICTNNV